MAINEMTYFLDFRSRRRPIASNREGADATRELIPHPPVAGRAEAPGDAEPEIYVTVSRGDPRQDRVARGPGARELGHRRMPRPAATLGLPLSRSGDRLQARFPNPSARPPADACQLAQPDRELPLDPPAQGAHPGRLWVAGRRRDADSGLPISLRANCQAIRVKFTRRDLHCLREGWGSAEPASLKAAA